MGEQVNQGGPAMRARGGKTLSYDDAGTFALAIVQHLQSKDQSNDR